MQIAIKAKEPSKVNFLANESLLIKATAGNISKEDSFKDIVAKNVKSAKNIEMNRYLVVYKAIAKPTKLNKSGVVAVSPALELKKTAILSLMVN